jgi:hypothetical protein
MPGPCSAPNGDTSLVFISEEDRVKAQKRSFDTDRLVLPAELFRERRARTQTGKTRKEKRLC